MTPFSLQLIGLIVDQGLTGEVKMLKEAGFNVFKVFCRHSTYQSFRLLILYSCGYLSNYYSIENLACCSFFLKKRLAI